MQEIKPAYIYVEDIGSHPTTYSIPEQFLLLKNNQKFVLLRENEQKLVLFLLKNPFFLIATLFFHQLQCKGRREVEREKKRGSHVIGKRWREMEREEKQK